MAPDQPRVQLTRTAAAYTLARLGLLAFVAALLVVLGVPVLVALLLALLVSLPLSLLMFRGLRARFAVALDAATARRRAARDRLRAELRGEAGGPGPAS